MAASWAELIDGALLEIGVLISGEPAQPKDREFGLAQVKRMLDGWALEGQMLPARARAAHDVVADSRVFTMSSGADPQADIEGVAVSRVVLVDFSPGYLQGAIQLDEVNEREMERRVNESDLSPPTAFLFDLGGARSTLRFDRLARAGDSFEIIGDGYLPDDFAADDVPFLPRGYDRAVMLNLAVELLGAYGIKGNAVPRTLLSRAGMAKRDLRKALVKPMTADVDPMFARGGRGRVNFRTPFSG